MPVIVTVPDRPRPLHGALVAVRAVLGLALLWAAAAGAPVPAIGADEPQPLKAVVIVGPAAESTQEYLREGERIARQAEAQGMDVRRIYTPRATWSRVKANIQGAKLVVYLGHGNGWPSPYAPFQKLTKDGFGLNPCADTCGTSGPTRYFGEERIREEIRLGTDAVVLLHRICYASGNGEDFMGPEFDRDLVVARVSNFASGFLDAGAGAVFALGWRQRLDLPAELMTTDKTIDDIFESPRTPGWYDGFVGWRDHYATSTRNPGARIHLDPHPDYGHLRAVTGDLALTAPRWRGDGTIKDTVPPALRVHHAGTRDRMARQPAEAAIAFSPNGDGDADRLVLRERLSEAATVVVIVKDDRGRTVLRREVTKPEGQGRILWRGRSSAGRIVPDGSYRLRLVPIDAAGNRGRWTVQRVQVLNSATRPRWTATALHPADGDRLASDLRATTRVGGAARVRWTITRDGRTVRTLARGLTPPGHLTVRWNGRDAAGRLVSDGPYRSVLALSSRTGSMRFTEDLWVGPYQVSLDPPQPRRGRPIRIVVRSTEPQTRPPVIIVRASGIDPIRLGTRRTGPDTSSRTVRLPAVVKRGRFSITVIGSDRGGQIERAERSWQLR